MSSLISMVLQLIIFVFHLPKITTVKYSEWPEFREYAQRKYRNELDEDVVSMIEDLIERRRRKGHKREKGYQVGI